MDSIKVRKFRPGDSLETINGWRKNHGLELLEAWELPIIGFMAFYDDIPVAAAFLRQCEGGLGIMDSLISDPEVMGAIRHVALDRLFQKIIERGTDIGLKAIIGYTVDDSTHSRSVRHGFKQLPHAVMTRPLSQRGVISQ